METSEQRYQRFSRLLADEALPAALVDLEAFDRNADSVFATVRPSGKTLRLASKSVRCVALLRRLFERGGGIAKGLMTYAASETAYLASVGFDDLLLAYPTVLRQDAEHLARAAASGKRVRVVCDAAGQLDSLERAASAADTSVGVVIEVDMSFRPVGELHLGVRRSPLRSTREVLSLVAEIRRRPHLRFDGLMGYEAQIAGVTDRNPFSRAMNAPKRAMKHLSRRDVEARREELHDALSAEGIACELFNGGGSGSLSWAKDERWLTELTAGSAFLAPHLFGYYEDLKVEPASYFALQVVRHPAPGLATCLGGGFVASGEAGADRLPLPSLPEGVALLPVEGAGEVQTPLRLPEGMELPLGAPVFFRHAKAGELAEHFNEYLLVYKDQIEARVRTYRGEGHCFLG